MKCPNCGNESDTVVVASQAWQIGYLDDDGKTIAEYGDLEVGDTISVNCPECDADLTDVVLE